MNPYDQSRASDAQVSDADEASARAILAQYDIHLRADEPLTPALLRVAGQLRARNLPRPGPVQHTTAGGHTFGGAAAPPPPLEVAAAWSSMEPSADEGAGDGDENGDGGSGDDAPSMGVDDLPLPPPPPEGLLVSEAGPEELLCATPEAGVETKTTDVRAGRARRASTGRVRARRGSRPGEEQADEQQADAGADDAAASAGMVECPDRERREYELPSSPPVRAPQVCGDDESEPGEACADRGSGDADDSTAEDDGSGYRPERDYTAILVAGGVLPPSIGGAEDTEAAAAGTDAADAVTKWQRGEWLCELRETRKRSGHGMGMGMGMGMGIGLGGVGAVDYLFDMTAPSVGEEWARRWTVTKRFSDFQTLDACVRALYPDGCEALPIIPRRRFSLGGFTDLTEGLGESLSVKLSVIGGGGGGNGAGAGAGAGSGPGSADGSAGHGGGPVVGSSAADKAIDERTKLLSGWSLCALSLAVPGGPLADCHEIKDFFGPEEVDSARMAAADSAAAGTPGDGDGTEPQPQRQSQRRGSIGEALSSSFSRLGSFRRSSTSTSDAEAAEADADAGAGGLAPPTVSDGTAGASSSAGGSRADGRRGSIGDRAMAALGAGMSAMRASGSGSGKHAPGVVGVASVEEWAVVGVVLRARHNTALTAECDAAVIPGTTIPAPAVATGELQAGENAGAVLEVRYSNGSGNGTDGGMHQQQQQQQEEQLRVRLEGGWASVVAKDGTQLLEPQPRI
jgi:hypothetical protein